jgi:hypothetical protein
MEDVLEVYLRPYNPNEPVVCMDDYYKQMYFPSDFMENDQLQTKTLYEYILESLPRRKYRL